MTVQKFVTYNSLDINGQVQNDEHKLELNVLDESGNYDNYISNSRGDAPELWDLSLHCESKTLFASGGFAFEAINLFTVDPFVDSIRAKRHTFTKNDTNVGQDLIRSVIDLKGNYFSLLNYPKSLTKYDYYGNLDTNFGKFFNGLFWVNDSLNGHYYQTDLAKFTKFQEYGKAII